MAATTKSFVKLLILWCTLFGCNFVGLAGLGGGLISLPVRLRDQSSHVIGRVVITETPGGIYVDLEITDLPPGQYFLQIHAGSVCGDPGFQAAGPEWQPAVIQAAKARAAKLSRSQNTFPFPVNVGPNRRGANASAVPNLFVFEDIFKRPDVRNHALILYGAPSGNADSTNAPALACGVVPAR